MRKNKMTRLLAGAMAGAMLLSFAACGKTEDSKPQQETADGKLFAPGTEISIVIGSHESWPYRENWKIWQYFQEATGATFKIQAIPNTDMDTKVNLIMSSPEKLPDLLHVINKHMVDSHALSGAFVSLTANMDEKMPYFKKFLETLPEEEREERLAQRRSGDGEVYFAPVFGTETVLNLRTWMYRKDIFEKNGLSVPTDLTELYDVSKKLKEIYPNSYPLCFRNGLQQINVMGPMWRNDFNYSFYYDFKDEKWRYGAAEDTMKDVIAFFHKMSDAQLVPPDFLTINDKSWEELVSTDRGFIMPEYLVRIDFFNNIGRTTKPEYTWAAMAPLKGDGATGQAKIAKYNLDPTGYLICNTGKQDRIDNAFKLLDWMYSDEGSELLSWGKEGETYEVVDGKKKFILGENETAEEKYGASTYGLIQRVEVAAYEAVYSEEQIKQGHEAVKYIEEHANPILWLPLNDAEMKIYDAHFTALDTYTQEMLSKFLLKQEPMSKWDAFQKGLKETGLPELLEMYTNAYARVMGK